MKPNKNSKSYSQNNLAKPYLVQRINKNDANLIFNSKITIHTSLSKLAIKTVSNFRKQSRIQTQIYNKQKQLQKTFQEKQTQWVEKRIKSLRKISLNIKKMEQIFKPEYKLTNANPLIQIKEKTLFNHDLRKARKIKQKNNIQYQELQQQLKIVKPSKIFNVHKKFQFMAGINFKSNKSQGKQKKTQNEEQSITKKQANNHLNLVIKKKLLSLPSQDSYMFDSPIKYSKNKIIHTQAIDTLKKFQDSLKVDKQDLQKTIINQVREMRKTQNLQKQPKQWHFHNFFNLNNIQLYQTNLKISCQGWAVIDFLELKFIRGWNPKEIYDFTPMIRLLIIKCFQSLQKDQNLILKNIRHRINYKNIKEKVKIHQKKQNKKSIIQQQGYTLRNHTILDIESLIIGMCKQNNIDLLWCLIHLIGYLIYQENVLHQSKNYTPRQSRSHTPRNHKRQSHDQPIYFQTNQMLPVYQSYFLLKSKEIIQQLQLKSTQIITQGTQFIVSSNCLDVSVLFMSCLKFQLFKDISLNKVNSTRSIKYQVGWNYWQNRTHTFNFSKCYQELANIGYFGIRDFCKDHKQECSLVYHPQRQTIFIMGSAKINMYLSDVKNIQKWVIKTIKRFSPKKIKQQKLCKVMLCQQHSSKTQLT